MTEFAGNLSKIRIRLSEKQSNFVLAVDEVWGDKKGRKF
jgi:hypothetical protein